MLKKYGEKKLQGTCKSRSRRNLLLYNKVSVHMILTYVLLIDYGDDNS